MTKPWNKHKKRFRHRGPCFAEGCNRRGGQKHTCRVCESLVEKGKLEAPFAVQYCAVHAVDADRAIRKHVLSKHKAVAFLTALKVGYEE
jgi:hypothetical protein